MQPERDKFAHADAHQRTMFSCPPRTGQPACRLRGKSRRLSKYGRHDNILAGVWEGSTAALAACFSCVAKKNIKNTEMKGPLFRSIGPVFAGGKFKSPPHIHPFHIKKPPGVSHILSAVQTRALCCSFFDFPTGTGMWQDYSQDTAALRGRWWMKSRYKPPWHFPYTPFPKMTGIVSAARSLHEASLFRPCSGCRLRRR